MLKPINCCISFDSYIKPQHLHRCTGACYGCISFDSYIKPQPRSIASLWNIVVYLLTPTSNHNLSDFGKIIPEVVYLLTPTSNHNSVPILSNQSSVVYLLTPTSNHNFHCSPPSFGRLYIFWLLHQTTTTGSSLKDNSRCISFDSYIKPQLYANGTGSIGVVYLLTPTSNHNFCSTKFLPFTLYIFWLLHQTTTYAPSAP